MFHEHSVQPSRRDTWSASADLPGDDVAAAALAAWAEPSEVWGYEAALPFLGGTCANPSGCADEIAASDSFGALP